MNVLDKEPNIVHKYLTKLEKDGKLKAVVTQNIDGLDKKSGTKMYLKYMVLYTKITVQNVVKNIVQNMFLIVKVFLIVTAKA